LPEGNEGQRDGHAGIGALHSTREAGELVREDPVEGRGRLVAEPWPGNGAGALDLDSLFTTRPRVAPRTPDCDETSRMP
jgi:hypothetical protein